jgi:hypothetical protein
MVTTTEKSDQMVPDRELVKTLETLLRQAKSGELEGFAAALLLHGSRVGMTISREARGAPSTTIGVLWQIQHRIQAHLDEPFHSIEQ